MKSKNIAIFSLIFILVSTYLLYEGSRLHTSTHLSDWLRSAPIYFISKAQQSLNRQQSADGVAHIKNAVTSIKSIERYTAPDVKKHMDRAIFELDYLSDQLLHGQANEITLNHVFFGAINAVAYAELRISEKELELGGAHQALAHMKTVQILLQRSLYYADTTRPIKNEELKIISHVKSLISEIEKSGTVSEQEFTQINSEIEALLNKMLKTDYGNLDYRIPIDNN
jgi:hypothetical protein